MNSSQEVTCGVTEEVNGGHQHLGYTTMSQATIMKEGTAKYGSSRALSADARFGRKSAGV